MMAFAIREETVYGPLVAPDGLLQWALTFAEARIQRLRREWSLLKGPPAEALHATLLVAEHLGLALEEYSIDLLALECERVQRLAMERWEREGG